MVDERLTKSATFVSILHCLFVTNTGEAETLNYDADTFMVEIGHYDCLTMLA